MKKTALIATCTNRKKLAPEKSLEARNLPKATLCELAHIWNRNVQKENPVMNAIDLYVGRGFSEIRKINTTPSIETWIISAGLGLVNGRSKVPSYNLTISSSAKDSILHKVSDVFLAPQWWEQLNYALYGEKAPLCNLIEKYNDTNFIISIPKTYLSLVLKDLGALKKKDKTRIRLIGIQNYQSIPSDFYDVWMPYTEHFDGERSPNPGTKADFSQRVARHFIEEIYSKCPLGSPG